MPQVNIQIKWTGNRYCLGCGDRVHPLQKICKCCGCNLDYKNAQRIIIKEKK